MAKNTEKYLYNSTIYSVYIRNHSVSGDFKGLIDDLDRIAALGTNIIWLMPIHPIGEVDRKGSLGCPYSIKDYREVNPEYGTLEDFTALLNEIHSRSLKCIIDVVYNHTSKDSVLLKNHPEYFLTDEDGKLTGKVGEWSDVTDLDYSNKELWNELIDTLDYWCSLGVDGFRCDVAPLVPVEFWIKTRESIQSKYPDAIFLAETSGLDFVEYIRSKNFPINTDSEVFTAFDIEYDYDIFDSYQSLINDKEYFAKDFAQRLFIQNNTYPANAVKLRFLENHDNKRAAKLLPSYYELINYTALIFFQKGATLVYAGQETMQTHTPSLFEKDTISLTIYNQTFYDFLKRLIEIKKDVIFRDGFFYVSKSDDKNSLHLCYNYNGKILNGVFNLSQKIEMIKVNIKDGTYENILNGKKVCISNGSIKQDSLPAFFVID